MLLVSNVIYEAFKSLLSLLSAKTRRSPVAISVLVFISPPFVILPCVCEEGLKSSGIAEDHGKKIRLKRDFVESWKDIKNSMALPNFCKSFMLWSITDIVEMLNGFV